MLVVQCQTYGDYINYDVAEMPCLIVNSGAIAHRLIMLNNSTSVLGKEKKQDCNYKEQISDFSTQTIAFNQK